MPPTLMLISMIRQPREFPVRADRLQKFERPYSAKPDDFIEEIKRPWGAWPQ